MSADNGVYITEWKDGYRVAYGSAIDNIDYFDHGTPQWKEQNYNYFKNSPVYPTLDEAWKAAYVIAQDWDWTEYGVCGISGNRGEFPIFDGKIIDGVHYESLREFEKKGGGDPATFGERWDNA